jgi:hypothetical protein
MAEPGIILSTHLSDSEVDDICAGLKQNAAKVRFLERMGLKVRRKPNGRPLVSRSAYDSLGEPAKARASNDDDDSGFNWSKAA